jgi:hypothetical protein
VTGERFEGFAIGERLSYEPFHPMKPPLPLIALLIGLSAPLLGQQAASPQHHEASPSRFDLDFPGGTVSQLLDALASASKSKMNVVLSDGAGDIEVPRLRLVGVTASEVLGCLARMSESDRKLGRWKDINPWINFWTVTRDGTEEGETQTSVVYVGQLLTRYSIDDIAAAITFALNSPDKPGKHPLRLRLHKETSLLIIEASGRDIGTAGSVVYELLQSMKQATPH